MSVKSGIDLLVKLKNFSADLKIKERKPLPLPIRRGDPELSLVIDSSKVLSKYITMSPDELITIIDIKAVLSSWKYFPSIENKIILDIKNNIHLNMYINSLINKLELADTNSNLYYISRLPEMENTLVLNSEVNPSYGKALNTINTIVLDSECVFIEYRNIEITSGLILDEKCTGTLIVPFSAENASTILSALSTMSVTSYLSPNETTILFGVSVAEMTLAMYRLLSEIDDLTLTSIDEMLLSEIDIKYY